MTKLQVKSKLNREQVINYNKIYKRFMMKRFQKVYTHLENLAARDYATLVAAVRKNPPLKVDPHPGAKGVTEEGKTELHDTDYSGKNHILMINADSGVNNAYVDVPGIFTTKPTPYKGVIPTEVSDRTLDKQQKKQYLHEKMNTVIKKNAIEVDINATIELQTRPDLVAHGNRIKIEQNLE